MGRILVSLATHEATCLTPGMVDTLTKNMQSCTQALANTQPHTRKHRYKHTHFTCTYVRTHTHMRTQTETSKPRYVAPSFSGH